MFKINKNLASALSIFVFTTLCLLASTITAQAQVEPQQGAINTTRSNIKNTSRTGHTRFDPLIVDLKKASGESVASRKVADSDGDGKLSEAEGKFNFGIMPGGNYVLAIATDPDGDTLLDGSKQSAKANGASAASNLTLNLDGVEGGSIKKDMAPLSESEANGQSGERAGGRPNPPSWDSSGGRPGSSKRTYRPGAAHYGNISLKVSGRSEVKGTVITKHAK